MSLDITEIETKLAEAGVVTDYYGDDDRTIFTMTNGGTVIELQDAVSGEFFRSEDLTYAGKETFLTTEDVTAWFENVETMDEFITAVNDTFGMVA